MQRSFPRTASVIESGEEKSTSDRVRIRPPDFSRVHRRAASSRSQTVTS